ncbi:MAG: SDR family oxidoreductase [Rhizomicrobium sp.]|jgi:NAD(P)-dependent dehydrogenase (short-subunit alcohol dehydrogenase family)
MAESGIERTPEGATDRAYTIYDDLKSATVFITGGGSGIGAYLTYAFAAQGARVAFLSLSEQAGRELCDAVEHRTGNRPLFVPCDLADIDAVQRNMTQVAAQLGPIRVLINNAARDDRHDVTSFSAADWDRSIHVNLRPHYFTAQAVVGGMRAAGGGSIINVGSNSANLGLSGYPVYVTAKAGIVGLTRALARELGPSMIRVNALIPGWVMTQRQKALWVTDDAIAQCLSEQCLKETIEGEDIADAALFLASIRSRMITGQSLIVDGGRAMS